MLMLFTANSKLGSIVVATETGTVNVKHYMLHILLIKIPLLSLSKKTFSCSTAQISK